MGLRFVDSESPPLAFPAGISVTVSAGGSIVGTFTTDASGATTFVPATGTEYLASFSGPGAPTTTQAFTGGATGYVLMENGNRLTTESGDPIVVETNPATQTVQVAGYTPSHVRVSQLVIEPLAAGSPKGRVSQLAIEPLVGGAPKARLSQLVFEVIVPVIPYIVSIAVSPVSASVGVGKQLRYMAIATYNDGRTQDVSTIAIWTATNGGIDSTGLFTATTAGTGTVSAAITNPGAATVIGSTSVTVTVAYALILSPYSTAVETLGTNQYTALITGTDGTSVAPPSVAWSATAGGSIDQTGLFTAGPDPTAAVSIKAIVTSGPQTGLSALAVVTIASTAQLLPASLASLGIIGAISLDLEWGGDLTLTPAGNLLLATDTRSDPRATRQWLERLILTNPTLRDAAQNPIGRADDLFNPNFGAGIRSAIGRPSTGALAPAIANGIRLRVLDALQKSSRILQSPAPVVTVTEIAGEIVLSIQCETTSGSVTIPSLPLTGTS